MKNKKSFLLRDIVITGILFTGLMALMIILVSQVASNYNRPDMVSQSFANNFDKLSTMKIGVENSRIAMTNTNNTGLQLLGNVDVAFGSTWNVINLVFSTVDLYFSMGASIVSVFPFMDKDVVKIFMYIMISLLVVMVIFNVISSVMRGRL